MTLSAPLPHTTHRKAFALELKSVTEEDGFARFSSIASAVGVLDQHGDVIEAGAFDETLATKGGTLPLLWQHDQAQPIGVIKVSVDQRGDLIGEGEINLAVRKGAEAYALLKQGAVKAMSIGFNIPADQAKWDKDAKVLRILQVDLWETSLVTFPANPGAQILDVKTAAQAELEAVKAGRVLSAKNRLKVEDARDALNAVLEAATGPEDADTAAAPVGNHEAADQMIAWKALVHEIRSHRNVR
jgi:uncharacterized protein